MCRLTRVSVIGIYQKQSLFSFSGKPGAIARSVVMSLGNQGAPRSILASGTSFLGHGIISTAILPLQLIKEEQLSVNGERMCAKYWLPASGRLA